jgi:hypothetical protein
MPVTDNWHLPDELKRIDAALRSAAQDKALRVRVVRALLSAGPSLDGKAKTPDFERGGAAR